MVTPVTSFCVLESKTEKLMGGSRAYVCCRKMTHETFFFCTGTLVPLETSAVLLWRPKENRELRTRETEELRCKLPDHRGARNSVKKQEGQ